MEVLDIVPEAACQGIAGGAGHNDGSAFWVLEPVKEAYEGGVKAFGGGSWAGPGHPVVVAEALEGAIDPRVPDNAGVLPDELDGGLAMDKGAGADIFGSGVEVALEGCGTTWEGEAFEGVAGLAELVHAR